MDGLTPLGQADGSRRRASRRGLFPTVPPAQKARGCFLPFLFASSFCSFFQTVERRWHSLATWGARIVFVVSAFLGRSRLNMLGSNRARGGWVVGMSGPRILNHKCRARHEPGDRPCTARGSSRRLAWEEGAT